MIVHRKWALCQFEWYRDYNKVITVSSEGLGRFIFMRMGRKREIKTSQRMFRRVGWAKRDFPCPGFIQ